MLINEEELLDQITRFQKAAHEKEDASETSLELIDSFFDWFKGIVVSQPKLSKSQIFSQGFAAGCAAAIAWYSFIKLLSFIK